MTAPYLTGTTAVTSSPPPLALPILVAAPLSEAPALRTVLLVVQPLT